MKIGICGVRGLGVSFMELFSLHPDVQSVSIADLDAEARAKARAKVEVKQAFEDFEDLLSSEVDCVGIFTPPWAHAQQAQKALRAGKHVIAACPMGLSLEEVDAVMKAVEETGNIYMTAETGYYHRAAIFARDAWRDGKFGEFIYGEGQYLYRPHSYDFWLRDFYGAMPPMLYPTHSTVWVTSIVGKYFTQVTCVGATGLHPDASEYKRRPEWLENEFSNMTLLGKLSGGGSCRINEMRNVGASAEDGSIFGTLGSLRQVSSHAFWSDGLNETIDLSELWLDRENNPQTEPASKLPVSYDGKGLGHDGSQRFLADEFVRAVINNHRPHNHAWLAARYCLPGIVAWQSVKQNSAWLDVPDYGEPSDGRAPLDY